MKAELTVSKDITKEEALEIYHEELDKLIEIMPELHNAPN